VGGCRRGPQTGGLKGAREKEEGLVGTVRPLQ
jgi:hypothetical protein